MGHRCKQPGLVESFDQALIDGPHRSSLTEALEVRADRSGKCGSEVAMAKLWRPATAPGAPIVAQEC
ncbi:hypothetical protein V2G26_017103 [Clonostachys chloroleuca]